MSILSKIWSFIKSVFAAFSKEPENNQLDVGIPESEDEVSTDVPVADTSAPVVDTPVVDTPAAVPAPEVTTEPTATVQDPNQPN